MGDDLLSSGAVNICENCRQSCKGLNDIPEFRFRGCDTCHDEAMEIMNKEAATLLDAAPTDCGSDHKNVPGDRSYLNPRAVEEKVA